jgi:SNF2 family DNA or RNA helicase
LGLFSYSRLPGFVTFSCEFLREKEALIAELLLRVPHSQIIRSRSLELEIPKQELEIMIADGWRPRPSHNFDQELLQDIRTRRQERLSFFDDANVVEEQQVEQRLLETNLNGSPTQFQLRNLCRMLRFRSGATFSVPGAGKTLEAICFWLFHRRQNERILIAMPKVASIAWKDEFEKWLGFGNDEILLLDKSGVEMRRHLSENSTKTVYLVNYHKMRLCASQIANFMTNTQADGWSMILDESHYIKNSKGSTSLAARQLSSYVDGCKLIMTGTPAPQGSEDLQAQAEFLQGLPLSNVQSRDLIQRLYVRTSKEDLNLLEPVYDFIIRPHKEPHFRAYDELLNRVIEEISPVTNETNLRSIRPHMMTLRRAATDPSSMRGMEFDFDVNELPWKFEYILERMRIAKESGRKIIIWSTFVNHLTRLEELLLEYNPAIVYGAIESDSLASFTQNPKIGSREWMFDKFKFDPSCLVLLANPAACGESISLHHWCSEAIYLDRSYNAAHYLQSKDRIHRYGTNPLTGEHTCRLNEVRYTILITESTIDIRIRERLEQKINAQQELLDSGQFDIALEEEGTQDDLLNEEAGGASNNDVLDFLNNL